jgi:outer membrane protein TolC
MTRAQIILSLFLTCVFELNAQVKSEFSIQDLFTVVLSNHPVAKQANLLPEQARFEIRSARGAFDPKLQAYFNEKEFNDKRYWNNLNTILKVPAWIGEFKGGLERNRGDFNNPEMSTPLSGLISAGYSLPLGAGLLIDERRSALRQAQLLNNISLAEKVSLINKLLLQAASDYWEWYFAFRQLGFIQEAFDLASVRFDAVKEMSNFGNQSGLDTLEAFSNLVLRDIQLQQAKLLLLNSRLVLSNHLWDENTNPVLIDSTASPMKLTDRASSFSLRFLDSLETLAIKNHPDLLKLNAKLNQLDIERRFAAEMLKPTIDLEYNFLQAAGNNPVQSTAFQFSNYKFGLSLGMPLLLRKERGKLQSTKVKISLTELDRINRQRTIETEVKSRYNEVKNFEQLLVKQFSSYDALRRLVFGEQERFRNGESSIFVINARETNLVAASVKLAEMEAKYAKAIAYLYWSAGTIDWKY